MIVIKTQFFLLILLLFVFPLQAKKLPGYFFDGKDTTEVTFKIPMHLWSKLPVYEKLQKKVRFLDDMGEIQTLRPNEVEGYVFSIDGRNIKMISNKNTIQRFFNKNNQYIFLRMHESGFAKLFTYYFSTITTDCMGNSDTENNEVYLLKKGNNDFTRLTGFNVMKKIRKALSDCPDLLNKIDNKEFRRRDIPKVVRFYNDQCHT